MDDKKLESRVQPSAGHDVSAGEPMVLSKDEQHLAKLGYKQGQPTRDFQEGVIDTVNLD